jgi:hypothetical protein
MLGILCKSCACLEIYYQHVHGGVLTEISILKFVGFVKLITTPTATAASRSAENLQNISEICAAGCQWPRSGVAAAFAP